MPIEKPMLRLRRFIQNEENLFLIFFIAIAIIIFIYTELTNKTPEHTLIAIIITLSIVLSIALIILLLIDNE